jgi:hypothetical protein
VNSLGQVRLRSGPLAAWTTAWLAGQAASDDAIRAVTGTDAPHRVSQPGAEPVPLGQLLIEWRRLADRVRLVLPVPGDVRGLPGPSAFRRAALDTGEAAVGGLLGVVPAVTSHHPSSAPATVLWQCFEVDAAPSDPLSVGEAEQDLTEAIRDCASALATIATASWAQEPPSALADARRAGEYVNLPPGHPPRAVRLVAQAERLRAVLDLAEADPTGGALSETGATARAVALRQLATAVRRARLAGYNAGSG